MKSSHMYILTGAQHVGRAGLKHKGLSEALPSTGLLRASQSKGRGSVKRGEALKRQQIKMFQRETQVMGPFETVNHAKLQGGYTRGSIKCLKQRTLSSKKYHTANVFCSILLWNLMKLLNKIHLQNVMSSCTDNTDYFQQYWLFEVFKSWSQQYEHLNSKT